MMSQQKNGQIKNAVIDDLKDIVRVHKICFPESFSTQLGEKLLERYYEEYLKRIPELFFIHVDNNNNIDGFCMGYILDENYPYMKKFINKNWFCIGCRLLFLAVTGNRMLFRKIKKTFVKEEYKIVQPLYYEDRKKGEFGDLLSICVLPELRGCGVAQDLVTEFDNCLIEKGCKGCILSTNTDNERGIRFYLKCGYEIYSKSENAVRFYRKLGI